MSAKPEQRPASCREFMEDLIGGGWRANGGSSAAEAGKSIRRPIADDLWYMVYKDAEGQLHTVKGATDSIRKNVAGGALGDVSSILVSRTKTGQFVSLKHVAEFRDLVTGPAPTRLEAISNIPTARLSATEIDPPPTPAPSSASVPRMDPIADTPATATPAPKTVTDITYFERPALNLDGLEEVPRPYTLDPASPAPCGSRWLAWLLLVLGSTIVCAAVVGLVWWLKR
jgi:hypothetical protein